MYNSKSKKRYLWKINVLVYLTIQNVNPCNINQMCYIIRYCVGFKIHSDSTSHMQWKSGSRRCAGCELTA